MRAGSETRTVTLKVAKLASVYERVHFVHHYLYNPNFTLENLLPYAGKIVDEICVRTGYMAFVRDIRIKQYPPFMTDVDFVIDAPAESPIAPAVIVAILKAIAIVIIAIAALGVVVLLFVTIWSERFEQYICEQCPDYPSFKGWAAYMGHLKDKHPKKFAGAQEAGASNWWEKVVPAIGGLIVLGVLLFALARPPERRS